MPRNRSEKVPPLVWDNPEKALAWARAVKDGERVGLVGPWFRTGSDREMDGAQTSANSKIREAIRGWTARDHVQLNSLPSDLRASNDQRIARANIILGSQNNAKKQK